MATDYITLSDALVRVSFHLFDLDREDLQDAILDVFNDVDIHNAPAPDNERMMMAFMLRMHAISTDDAIDVVCKELDKRDSGLSDILANTKDL